MNLQPGNSIPSTKLAIRRCFCQAASMTSRRTLRTLTGIFGLLLAGSGAIAGELETYRYDPVHSQIVFFVGHLGFAKGVGRLKLKSGWFQFDPDDFSRARTDLVIDLANVDMGDTKWSDTVKSGQFFDVGDWPTARFVSRSVEKTGADKNTGIIHGELTFQKISVPIDVEFTFNKSGRDSYAFKQKAGFSAHATLKRGALGLTRYQNVVGEDVELRIEVEGVRDNSAGPATNAEANPSGQDAMHDSKE